MKSPALADKSRRWWVPATVLLLIGAGCFGLGLRNQPRSLAGPPAPSQHQAGFSGVSTTGTADPLRGRVAHRSAAGSPVARSAPADQSVPVARSTPVALRIPAIGVSVSLSELGLNPDRTVQVPTDFQQPGWFQPGPSPGQRGSAVILGHVDSYQGPAVFFRIRALQKGDTVEVRLADGIIAHFVVRAVAMYSKTQFPARKVYGSHGGSTLQLVTCGGIFDRATGHYQSNVVAYTSLVGTTPPAGHR